MEIVTNKLNPQVLPHLHIWGWEVPIYLFLGGLSAGLLIITAAMILMRKGGIFSKDEPSEEYSMAVKIGSVLSPVLLGIGMFFLFLDLEYKIHVWRFYTNFVYTSPMSWGSWMLIIFFPVSAMQALVVNREYLLQIRQAEPLIPLTKWLETHLNKIAAINFHMGVGVGVYTGVLLSSFYARPLWSSSILGFVFLLSGLSSAAALLVLLAPRTEKGLYSKIDMYMIALEGFAVTLFIVGGITASENVKDAMIFLIGGSRYTPWFWIVVVLGGMLIPLLLETLEVMERIRFSVLVPLLVLLGGISLRFIIVYAGQAIPTFS
ncbi:MAG: polysulfide reductase NrfD [SAR324 cluster bacterium]|nr:polysulfide reductase NrfD [SAR324 cluster bacterium]MBF0351887.1 polysulfide reductase NrfD [SAR324 cluster bacterium]